MKIHGIECFLEGRDTRQVVYDVLLRIKQGFPEHFRRIKRRNRAIHPMSACPPGVLDKFRGQVVGGLTLTRTPREILKGLPNGNESLCQVPLDEILESVVFLPEISDIVDIPDPKRAVDWQTIIVAHEFGHVCMMQIDLKRRHAPDHLEGVESVADWYTWRWGFRKLLLEVANEYRILPGRVIEIGGEWYRMSQNFVFRPATIVEIEEARNLG